MNDIKIGKLYKHIPTGIVRRVVYVGKNYVTLKGGDYDYSRCNIENFKKFWRPYEAPNDKAHDDKVFELPFAIGDKVWFIRDDKVHEGTLTKCDITINKDDTRICYNVLYYNRINCSVVTKGIASNKLFKTKKELLESL